MSTPTPPDAATRRRPQRQTRQRSAVEAYLATATGFRTAQRIHEDLRAAGETLGLATVYRTLQAMAEAAEVDVLRTPEGEAYRRCSTGHHHHLVCRVCRRAVEVAGTEVEAWARQVAEQHGFTDVAHEVEVYGTCADCAG